jgi:hypothetical protein
MADAMQSTLGGDAEPDDRASAEDQRHHDRRRRHDEAPNTTIQGAMLRIIAGLLSVDASTFAPRPLS